MMNILRDEKQTRRAYSAAQDCLRLCSARPARPGREMLRIGDEERCNGWEMCCQAGTDSGRRGSDEWMRGAEKQIPGAVHRYVRCRSSARGIS
jgi:hypothetical protein